MFSYAVKRFADGKRKTVDAFEAMGDADAIDVAKTTFARLPSDKLELWRRGRLVHTQDPQNA